MQNSSANPAEVLRWMGSLTDNNLATADAADRPTSVRWRVIALLMAYSAVNHFNRTCMPAAGTEHILKEYDIDETQIGMVYSAFLLAYTICMTPGGWVIDRWGGRRALAWMGF